jgi:hypothetical protein
VPTAFRLYHKSDHESRWRRWDRSICDPDDGAFAGVGAACAPAITARLDPEQREPLASALAIAVTVDEPKANQSHLPF